MKFRDKRKRTGAHAIELAIVLPLLIIFFFGLWEWSRVEMMKHVCETAAFEGAREGTMPAATTATMETAAQEVLALYNVDGETITATIDGTTRKSTIQISIPLDENTLVTKFFFFGQTITREFTLSQQIE
jgi:Flp pilus assembly protein TadG